jgi:hypothetical protein
MKFLSKLPWKLLSKLPWKRIGKISLLVLLAAVALFFVVWGGFRIARVAVYDDYLSNKETVCKIPGLNKGFVPQGLTHVNEKTYIFTGYVGKTHELAIYIVENDTSKEIIPIRADGTRWSGHAGGAAVPGHFLYVAKQAG